MKEPFETGYYYHIYNRGNNQENIFIEDINYEYFIILIKKYLIETCNIYAYCLLPNHFHILFQIKSLSELSEQYKNGSKKKTGETKITS